MTQQQDGLGALTPAVVHFQKVTASYWDGLFHCYQVKDLPRTNNDLEQFFGTARHVERRVDFPQASIAHSGCARLGARSGGGASRLPSFLAAALRAPAVTPWRVRRPTPDYTHEGRRNQQRLRRDP